MENNQLTAIIATPTSVQNTEKMVKNLFSQMTPITVIKTGTNFPVNNLYVKGENNPLSLDSFFRIRGLDQKNHMHFLAQFVSALWNVLPGKAKSEEPAMTISNPWKLSLKIEFPEETQNVDFDFTGSDEKNFVVLGRNLPHVNFEGCKYFPIKYATQYISHYNAVFFRKDNRVYFFNLQISSTRNDNAGSYCFKENSSMCPLEGYNLIWLDANNPLSLWLGRIPLPKVGFLGEPLPKVGFLGEPLSESDNDANRYLRINATTS